MMYVGIDLAWGTSSESGYCVISEDKEVVELGATALTDSELVQWLKGLRQKEEDIIVSVDAPLSVKNEFGGRKCDSQLMKCPINGKYLKLYATSRDYMLRTFGSIRGESIMEELEKDGFVYGENIVETFPTGIYLSLFPESYNHKYKISSKLSLEELKVNGSNLIKMIKHRGYHGLLLDELSERIEKTKTKSAYKHLEDEIDGVLCAINSWFVKEGEILKFEDEGESVVLPILRF